MLIEKVLFFSTLSFVLSLEIYTKCSLDTAPEGVGSPTEPFNNILKAWENIKRNSDLSIIRNKDCSQNLQGGVLTLKDQSLRFALKVLSQFLINFAENKKKRIR